MNENHTGGTPNREALAQINRFTHRALKAEEVYTFPVTLCDNEIDRDGERFSDAALTALAGLFPGKSGLFDHSMHSADQCARLYAAAVETDGTHTTKAGLPYKRLKGFAYMLRSEKSRGLIEEIEAGIKREVSVGCAMAKTTCSICGADLRADGCSHRRGEIYGGKLCHAVLDQPTDAYEWSFVAVPAQPAAGVTKTFRPIREKGDKNREDILTTLKNKTEGVTLDGAQTRTLLRRFETLEREAEDGRQYRRQLQAEVRKLCAVTVPQLDAGGLDVICSPLDVPELLTLKRAFAARADELLPPTPQLAPREKAEAASNDAFLI